MTYANSRRRGGAHRKQSKTAIRARVAAVTFTASAVGAINAPSGLAAPVGADGATSGANQSSESTRTVETATPTSASPAEQRRPQAEAPASAGSEDAAQDADKAPETPRDTPLVLAVDDFTPSADLTSQLATALSYNMERIARDMAMRAPLISRPAEGAFTSGFGPRWGSFHYGIDIANVTNTPIMSVMDGTIIDSGPAGGYGQWIRVLHDDGAISVYGHLESLYVAVGQRVTAGQVIGGMGNRGFSTGTHLHFEIHPDGVTPVDPISWFLARGLSIF